MIPWFVVRHLASTQLNGFSVWEAGMLPGAWGYSMRAQSITPAWIFVGQTTYDHSLAIRSIKVVNSLIPIALSWRSHSRWFLRRSRHSSTMFDRCLVGVVKTLGRLPLMACCTARGLTGDGTQLYNSSATWMDNRYNTIQSRFFLHL